MSIFNRTRGPHGQELRIYGINNDVDCVMNATREEYLMAVERMDWLVGKDVSYQEGLLLEEVRRAVGSDH